MDARPIGSAPWRRRALFAGGGGAGRFRDAARYSRRRNDRRQGEPFPRPPLRAGHGRRSRASAANHLAGKTDVILAVGPKHSASLPGSESITPKIDLGPDGARTSVRRACEGEVTADTISSAF